MSGTRKQLNEESIFRDVGNYDGLFQAGISLQGKLYRVNNFAKSDECDKRWHRTFTRLKSTMRFGSNQDSVLGYRALIEQAMLFGYSLVAALNHHQKVTSPIADEFNKIMGNIADYRCPGYGHDEALFRTEQVYKLRLAILALFDHTHPSNRIVEFAYQVMSQSIEQIRQGQPFMDIKERDKYLNIEPVAKKYSPAIKKGSPAVDPEQQLLDYINRIEKHTKKNGQIDYEHGFWIFSKSRALNRQANYLLAKDLLSELRNNSAAIAGSVNQKTLLSKRDSLFAENNPHKNQEYTQRKIRDIHSWDLNAVISRLRK